MREAVNRDDKVSTNMIALAMLDAAVAPPVSSRRLGQGH